MKLLQDIQLKQGAHATPEQGMCAMEAVAWYMDETHNDHPQCVSPSIAAAMREFNDWLLDAKRDEVLKPLLLEVIGTNTTLDDEITRAKIASQYAQEWAKSVECAESAKYAAESAKWAESAEYAAKSAKWAAKSAKWAESAEWAAKWAAKSAEWAASDFDYSSISNMILDMCKVGR